MTKYYLWGNGCSCWTIDLWKGRRHFEMVKEFKVKVKPTRTANNDLDARRQIQTDYLERRIKAVKYLVKLMAETGIPAVGGMYE